MFLAPEIRFETISAGDIQTLAEDLQRALPAVTVTPYNAKSRPTDCRNDDAVALRLQEDGKKKVFMTVGPKGATVLLENASEKTFSKSIQALSERVDLKKEHEGMAQIGITCTIIFLALFALLFVKKAIPEGASLTVLMSLGLVLLFFGLTALGIRSIRSPEKGRSILSIIFLVPGVAMLAPMSLLNIPLVSYFRLRQGWRLIQSAVSQLESKPADKRMINEGHS